MVAALAAARELPQLSLEDALELTLLVARKDPRRHPRVAPRWLHEPTDACGYVSAAQIAAVVAAYVPLVETMSLVSKNVTGTPRSSRNPIVPLATS